MADKREEIWNPREEARKEMRDEAIAEKKAELGDKVREAEELLAVVKMPGGRRLVRDLRETVAADVYRIISLFSAPEMELRCAIAKLNADLDMYRRLIAAEPDAKIAHDELSALLKEEHTD